MFEAVRKRNRKMFLYDIKIFVFILECGQKVYFVIMKRNRLLMIF